MKLKIFIFIIISFLFSTTCFADAFKGIYDNKVLPLSQIIKIIKTNLYQFVLKFINNDNGIILFAAKNANGKLYRSKLSGNLFRSILHNIKLLWIAIYISLLNLFQIGWEDFNIANCLKLMQFKAYHYEFTGIY